MNCIVEVVEDDLRLQVGDASASLPLGCITRVTAFKVDEFTVNTIWVEVESSERRVSFSEECEGFDAAMAALAEQLPRFYSDWRNVVVLPPFAANRTVLYAIED